MADPLLADVRFQLQLAGEYIADPKVSSSGSRKLPKLAEDARFEPVVLHLLVSVFSIRRREHCNEICLTFEMGACSKKKIPRRFPKC